MNNLQPVCNFDKYLLQKIIIFCNYLYINYKYPELW